MSQSDASGAFTPTGGQPCAGYPPAQQAEQDPSIRPGGGPGPVAHVSPPGALWYMVEGINPQPWQASEGQVVGKSRKIVFHKPEQLRFYQQALAISFEQQNPGFVPLMTDIPLMVRFYFWREIEVIEGTSGKIAQSNVADATNLQKAAEDALQDVLYGNDQNNVDIRSRIMEQAIGVAPRILIMVAPDPKLTVTETDFVLAKVKELHKEDAPAPSNILPDSNDELF